MTIDAGLAATIALAAFAALSFYDGIVVHFLIERLPFRDASRVEHRLHTARALLFPAILISFFGGHGPVVLSWTLLAIDQGLDLWDMAVERGSRDHTAGLPTTEYIVHGWLTTLRTAAIVFTAMLGRHGIDEGPLDALVSLLFPGAVLAAVVHLVSATAWGRSLRPIRGTGR